MTHGLAQNISQRCNNFVPYSCLQEIVVILRHLIFLHCFKNVNKRKMA